MRINKQMAWIAFVSNLLGCSKLLTVESLREDSSSGVMLNRFASRSYFFFVVFAISKSFSSYY